VQTYAPSIPASERERLILEFLPQVRSIAHRIHDRLPDTFYVEDLIQVGVLGLIAAIDNFDPSYNVKLSTYAEHKIRGAILDSIRGADGVPPHKRKRLKEIEAAIAKLEQRLQRAPQEEEIAAELNMDIREYQQCLQDVRGISIGSLDVVSRDGQESSLLNFISDTEENLPARQFERAELETLLAEAIRRMPKTERTILSLYYTEGRNLREIAVVMKLHLTRISQLKTQAVLRLRSHIEKKWPCKGRMY
jgi:RNA polymerase sigma factor for flagellar operon FliA